MHRIISESDAFNAVYNLAYPSVDATRKMEYPIAGIDFLSRYNKSPLFKNRSAEQIFDWFIAEHKFIFEHVVAHQNEDMIYFGYFKYFKIGRGLKYKNLEEFVKDVDWYKLERELRHPNHSE